MDSIINSVSGVLTFSSTDPTLAIKISDLTNSKLILTNDGTINVASSSLGLGSGQTFTNNGTVNYDYVAGIKQLADFSGKIYSNANKIIVNMSANESAKLILTDITGRNMQTTNLQGEKSTITTNNLKGIYIVRLLTSKGSYSQKICLN